MDKAKALPTPQGFVWTFPGQFVRAVDGDTIIAHIKIHPNEGGDLHEVNVRLHGINAPELNTAAGKAAKEYLDALFRSYAITLVCTKREKYGRFLARVIDSQTGIDASDAMLQAGHAVPYLT